MAVNQGTINIANGVNILDSARVFTDAWQDIGKVLNCAQYTSIVFWLDIEVNDSTLIYFRPVAFQKENTDDYYLLPTEEIHTGVNKFYPKKYQLQLPEDQKVTFQVNPSEMIPFIGIQIYDGTEGITDRAILKTIHYSARE